MNTHHSSLQEELDNLPEHYYETFSEDFLKLLAALRLHSFSIQRADEALPVVNGDDLWSEMGHSSVWIYAPTAPVAALRDAEPGSPEHTKLTNEVIRANLTEQQRLLALLEEFYVERRSSSFSASLIVETIDLGESNLRSQGASVRIILEDETLQRQWASESAAELNAFTEFLAQKIK